MRPRNPCDDAPMTEGTRPGVPRRTVVAGPRRRGPADRRLRHPARGRRAPRPPRADPHPGARRGRAGGPDPRARAALAELAATVPGALARRPRHAPPAPAHGAAQRAARAGGVPAADLDTTPSAVARTRDAPPRLPAGSPTPRPRRTRQPRQPSPAARVTSAAAGGGLGRRAASFAGVDPDLRATIAALHAQRYAAATLLRRPPADRAARPGRRGAGRASWPPRRRRRSTSSRSSAPARRAPSGPGPTPRWRRCVPCWPTSWPAAPGPTTALGHPLPFPVDHGGGRRPAGPRRR